MRAPGPWDLAAARTAAAGRQPAMKKHGPIFLALLATFKIGKVGGTVLTTALSIAAYSIQFGLPFATGFILLILCHELGHCAAARQRGLAVSAPAFIPFVGAFVTMKERPASAEVEAYVAFGGPLVGTLAAMLTYWAALFGHSRLLLALAEVGFTINLFNLIPISPLDGGRIVGVLSPRIWLAGAALLALFAILHPTPLLVAILILSIPSLIAAWKGEAGHAEAKQYYDVPLPLRCIYAGLFIGLVAVLATMTIHTHLLVASFSR